MKIYTKTGDEGSTSLLTGKRVSKADMRLEAYGTLDELNSWLGVLAAEAPDNCFPFLTQIQSELFSMGSYLALEGEANFPMPKLDASLVESLERQIDSWNEQLPELKNFILPSGSKASSMAQVARTVCRRAERRVVALADEVEVKREIPIFLNRLSDFFFVQARFILHVEGNEEIIWNPSY
ncbi:MAG: cob(I)yrinic acid a,c-diamide adenosyltransferase [Schleiferiaceae bacterium]